MICLLFGEGGWCREKWTIIFILLYMVIMPD